MYLQFLDLKQRFNWLHNELGKPCMISAKRLDVLYAINKDNFLLPPINMKRLRGNTLSIFWQETTKYTITSCRCKFRQLEREAGARFHQKPRELLPRFSQEANQALDNHRENVVTEVTSEVRRRDEQVFDLRTELSLQAPHQGDLTQHQSQEYVCLHQHLTGLVQESQQ